MPPLPKDLTVTQVISMFRGELELPVTNDARLIEEQAKKFRDRYLKMKNNPDPKLRSRADTWFKNVAIIQTQRDELIAILRPYFFKTADLLLRSSVSAGPRRLDHAVYTELEDLAQSQGGCDGPLARQLVDEYLAQRGLPLDAMFGDPRPVAGLRATSAGGRIRLTWSLPDRECDEVIVKRRQQPAGGARGRSLPPAKELWHGRHTEYTDDQVEVGQHYRYEVYSVARGVTAQSPAEATAYAVGEVLAPQARWDGEQILVSWQRPAPACEIVIYRASVALGPLAAGASALTHPHPQARLVYRGGGQEWRDQDIEYGKEFHYLIVAVFAPGWHSTGVPVSLRTPIPPPGVQAAEAAYRNGAVAVRWQATSGGQAREYVVLRKPGAVPSAGPQDGTVVATTRQLMYVDSGLPNGKQFIYTVFALRDGLHSRAGSATSPVIITAEASNITAEPGSGTVALRWAPPAEASTVLVHRLTDTGAVIVPSSGRGHALDSGLVNGQTYQYRVRCVYRPPTGGEALSQGVVVTATPSELPGEVTRLQVEPRSRQVVCSWEQAGAGSVVVLRASRPTPHVEGSLLPGQALDKLGHRLAAQGPAEAIDERPSAAEPWYTAYVISGARVRAGPSRQCVVTDDVANLRLMAEGEGVRLRWEWPERCMTVTIARRDDTWPEGVDDPQATLLRSSRSEYERNHNSYLDRTATGSRLYYVVYAQPADAPERSYAPGLGEGCRGSVEPGGFGQLRYTVSIKRRHGVIGPHGISLDWRLTQPPQRFAGFKLLVDGERIASEKPQGEILFRWQPQSPAELDGQQHRAWVQVEPQTLARLKKRCYYRLVHLDNDERGQVIFVHPDLGQPLIFP